MIIPFSEVIDNKSFINSELLRNLTTEHFRSLNELSEKEASQWDVKLTVNGIELKLSILETLYTKIEQLIDSEAKILFETKYQEKLEELNLKMDRLKETCEEATYKIATEYNITD